MKPALKYALIALALAVAVAVPFGLEPRGYATRILCLVLLFAAMAQAWNIVGGLAIGTMSHGMGFSDAARVYTLLTIGDGLVAQIPALLLSTAVAIIVTRMSRAQDLGSELARQLFSKPRSLAVAATILGVMGLIPGMPNLAFLTFAGLLGGAGVKLGVAGSSSRIDPSEAGSSSFT